MKIKIERDTLPWLLFSAFWLLFLLLFLFIATSRAGPYFGEFGTSTETDDTCYLCFSTFDTLGNSANAVGDSVYYIRLIYNGTLLDSTYGGTKVRNYTYCLKIKAYDGTNLGQYTVDFFWRPCIGRWYNDIGTYIVKPETSEVARSGYSLAASQTFNNTGAWTGNVSGSVASVTADVGITQAGADKVWGTTVRSITDKAAFSLASSQTFNNTGTWTGNLTGSVASVGSAVNINSNSDIIAIKTHTDSIAIDSNRVRSDMWAIDRQRTSQNWATLKLKELNVYNTAGTAVMIESDIGSAVDIGAYGNGDAAVLISSTAGPGMDIFGGQDAILVSGGMDGIDIDASHGHAISLNGGDTTSSLFINGGSTGWGVDILGFNLNTNGRVQLGGQGDSAIKVGDANNGKIGGIFNNDSLLHQIALASDSGGGSVNLSNVWRNQDTVNVDTSKLGIWLTNALGGAGSSNWSDAQRDSVLWRILKIQDTTFAIKNQTNIALDDSLGGTKNKVYSYLDEAISVIDDNPWDNITRSLTVTTGFSLTSDYQTKADTTGATSYLRTKTVDDKTGYSLGDYAPFWNVAFNTAFTAGSMGDSLNNASYVQGAASGLTAQQVWEYATRSLTDKAGFSLTSDYHTKADTTGATSYLRTKTVDDKTGYSLGDYAPFWNVAFNTTFTAGSMGDSLNNASYVQGAASGLTAQLVWEYAPRSLTAGVTLKDDTLSFMINLLKGGAEVPNLLKNSSFEYRNFGGAVAYEKPVYWDSSLGTNCDCMISHPNHRSGYSGMRFYKLGTGIDTCRLTSYIFPLKAGELYLFGGWFDHEAHDPPVYDSLNIIDSTGQTMAGGQIPWNGNRPKPDFPYGWYYPSVFSYTPANDGWYRLSYKLKWNNDTGTVHSHFDDLFVSPVSSSPSSINLWETDTSGSWNGNPLKFGYWNARAQVGVGGGGTCNYDSIAYYPNLQVFFRTGTYGLDDSIRVWADSVGGTLKMTIKKYWWGFRLDSLRVVKH